MSQNENGKTLSDFNVQGVGMCNALNVCDISEAILY